jgi:uncharacterized protein YkwD
MNWNAIDLLLALVVLAGAWLGWQRGLLAGGADLLALIVSVVVAFLAYPSGVALAERHGADWGVWTAPAAFLITFLAARLLSGMALGGFIRAVPLKVHAHSANRTLGVLPGAINGLIHAMIVALVLLVVPLSDSLTRMAGESRLANRLAEPAEWLEARLRPIFEPAVDWTLSRLTIPPDSRETVKLPFTVAAPKPRTDLEVKMLEFLNAERRAHGLRALQADPEAAEVARAHSSDMFARGYFSHISPQGEDPFDRMRRGGLRFRAAGENLAMARTLPMAHQGLMDSPGHRANILRPQFGRVGIGIVDGGRYGLMVTQKFRN